MKNVPNFYLQVTGRPFTSLTLSLAIFSDEPAQAKETAEMLAAGLHAAGFGTFRLITRDGVLLGSFDVVSPAPKISFKAGE